MKRFLLDIKHKFGVLAGRNQTTIDADDGLMACRAVYQNPSNDEYYEALERLKLANAKRFTLDHFMQILKLIWEDDQSGILFDALRHFDRNGNGYLEREELRRVLTTIGEPLPPEDFEDMLRLVDVNHDGKISYQGKWLTYLQDFP